MNFSGGLAGVEGAAAVTGGDRAADADPALARADFIKVCLQNLPEI